MFLRAGLVRLTKKIRVCRRASVIVGHRDYTCLASHSLPPFKLNVLAEISSKRRIDRHKDPCYFGIFNLYDHFISPIPKIKETISAIAGNGLTHEQGSTF